MKKKHLYGAMLWAFLVTANLCTGCSDDNDYPDVDGQNPTMTLATDHIESGAGHRFTIEGALEDKDGIASISLQCADLHLNKTIIYSGTNLHSNRTLFLMGSFLRTCFFILHHAKFS